ADASISELLAKTELTSSDRAFALELFYGALRNLTLLDFWIGCLRVSRVHTDLRDILRLGLYQLFLLKTAEHAAVHETVELAPKRQRTVINAMLRAATRRRSELLTRANVQPLFVRTSHPQFLVKRWQQHFGAEHAETLCKWNNLPAPVYCRINRLRTARDKFLQLYSSSRPLTGNSDFVEFDVLPTSALRRGHCYIQDPSTIIACQRLSPMPGEKILDACAAPGGKTGYVARTQERQIKSVRAVLPLLKPGGVIVYSTCSVEPEEYGKLVRRILKSSTALRLAEGMRWLRFRDGFDGAFAAKMMRIG